MADWPRSGHFLVQNFLRWILPRLAEPAWLGLAFVPLSSVSLERQIRQLWLSGVGLQYEFWLGLLGPTQQFGANQQLPMAYIYYSRSLGGAFQDSAAGILTGVNVTKHRGAFERVSLPGWAASLSSLLSAPPSKAEALPSTYLSSRADDYAAT